jgi:hypothetical protein
MGFISGWNETPKDKSTMDFCLWAAFYLLDHLRHQKHLTQQVSSKQWAGQFRILLKHQPQEQIRNVLIWYCENLNRPYLPQAFSARAFRLKFAGIEKAWSRSGKMPITIHPAAQKILGRLEQGAWPKGTRELLPQLIQLSLDAHADFKQRLLSQPANGLSRYLMERIGDGPAFVEVWVRDLNKLVLRPGWNGNLLDHVFDPKSFWFEQQAKTMAEHYCNDDQRWTSLLEVLYAN